MQTRNSSALAGIAPALFALCVPVLPGSALAASPNSNVTVVNTNANPVPVKGTVSVENSVLPVEVSNADPIPVAVGQPQVVQTSCVADSQINNSLVSCSLYTVPPGKRLVIQYVSAVIGASAIQSIIFDLELGVYPAAGGNLIFHHFLPIVSLISQPITMYVEANQQVVARFFRLDLGSQLNVPFNISGYLVDVP